MVGRREGLKERGGETGISQIDEKILFEVRLTDKCSRKHSGGRVYVRKINLRGNGRSQGREEPEWAVYCGHMKG